ncbi:branched-chain amino acid ABC transporter permease [Actinoplanes sp. TRM 88003]|uniref:Branched-chain amino acid ABC transporter permease n=1 Tax=Paractinoplanes aksuensis TaxID=2939490 RepID=A0ABT1DH74_9ACTN|nr:branched-chain amino acid ABC transporter permease [Actinoplanes aksuensis]MCO8269141.1 branched-chain amino acid ABC transporter permease [Actinoplanes aksuensis]
MSRRSVLIAAGVVTLAIPPLLPERHLATYVLLGLTAAVTAGVSLLMGYAGQVSLGQAAFYAIGAYGAGLLTVHGLPPVIGLVAAPVIAAVAAVVIGAPLLRLRGHHLAFATLAVQLILLSLLSQGTWAGGAIGLQGIPRLSVGGFELRDDLAYAYLSWLVLATVLLISRNVVKSRPGRALRAAATSEIAAASAGVPVGAYRLAVFALSAAFAGLAGGVYAFYLGYLSPGSFPVLLSIEFVVMAVVGGLGTLTGPVVGAVVIVLLVQLLNTVGTQPGMPSYAPTVFSYAVYALVLIAVVRYLPRGIVPATTRLLAKLDSAGPSSADAVGLASGGSGPATADSDAVESAPGDGDGGTASEQVTVGESEPSGAACGGAASGGVAADGSAAGESAPGRRGSGGCGGGSADSGSASDGDSAGAGSLSSGRSDVGREER